MYQLKEELPELNIINGGIPTCEQVNTLLDHVAGVMIGREAYNNPYFLRDVDALIYGDEQLAQGLKLPHISRHILGLYLGQPRARGCFGGM